MKAKARFVIPNVSAQAIGVDLRELYDIEITTKDDAIYPDIHYAIVKLPEKPLMQIQIADIAFEPHGMTIRCWFVFDHEGESPRLFQGAISIINS
jgi:hypothetical protein